MNSDPLRLVDKEQLAKHLGVRQSDLTAVVAGDLPRPVGYYRGRHVWDMSAVDSWIARTADLEPERTRMHDSQGAEALASNVA